MKYTISSKKIKKIHVWFRFAIQLLFFVIMPSVFTTAFSGVKYVFTAVGQGKHIDVTAFIMVLAAVAVFTIIFGRFFCGFACAFGSLGDWVHALYMFICKKIKKKPVNIKEKWKKPASYIKYMILTVIVIMCFTGAYSKYTGWSSWEVFSMLRAGNLKLGGHITGLVILIVIVAGMAVCERFFCRFLCPMGAVFALLPVLPVFSLARERNNCIKGCHACTMKCPSGIELPALNDITNENIEHKETSTADCFMCGKCIDICPKSNIKAKAVPIKTNEIIFTIFRAAILIAILIYAGI